MELFLVLTIAGISLVGGWIIGEVLDNKRYEVTEKEQQIVKDNQINCIIAEISTMLKKLIDNELIKQQNALDVGRIIVEYCHKDIDVDNIDTLLSLVDARLNKEYKQFEE